MSHHVRTGRTARLRLAITSMVAFAVAIPAMAPGASLAAGPADGDLADSISVERLLPPLDNVGDQFGSSVSVDRDLALVGATEDVAGSVLYPPPAGSGEAVLLARHLGGPGNWGILTHLTPADKDVDFGLHVSLSGDTAIVSNGSGASVFERDSGGPDTWGEVAVLVGIRPPTSIALQRGTAVLGYGAVGSGEVDVHQRGDNGWDRVATLARPDGAWTFGDNVALSGDTIIVNQRATSNDVTVFERNHGGTDNWGQTGTIEDLSISNIAKFGFDLALYGDTAVVSTQYFALNAVYVFERNLGGPGNWGLVSTLRRPPDAPVTELGFGKRVAVFDDTIVVVGDRAAYVHQRRTLPLTGWSRSDQLAVEAVGSGFLDHALGFDGDTILIGTPWYDSEGRVEVHQRSATGWDKTDVGATNPDTARGAYIGASVAIDGDTAVVGARPASSAGRPSDRSDVTVYERNESAQSGWSASGTVDRPDDASGSFGAKVAVSGDTMLVGDHEQDIGTDNVGAAYLFGRNVGGPNNWGLIAKIVGSAPNKYAEFGAGLALDGDTAIVGAASSYYTRRDKGTAYVFERNAGGPDQWGEVALLRQRDRPGRDLFGLNVALDGETAIVTAEGLGLFVFSRIAGDWTQTARLDGTSWGGIPIDIGPLDLNGNRIAVKLSDPTAGSGSIAVFERGSDNSHQWAQVDTIESPAEIDSCCFGAGLGLGDELLLTASYIDPPSGDSNVLFHAYSPNPDSDAWEETGQVVERSSQIATTAFAFDGTTAFFGNPFASTDLGFRSGEVFVVQLQEGSAPSTATLTIVEDATPDDRTNFRFGGGLGVFRLDDPTTDDDDEYTNSATFTVEPGTVRVRQQVFSRWNLDAIDCTTPRSSYVTDLDKQLLLLDVEAGETITCTFANSRVDAPLGTINVRVGDDADADGRFDSGETWVEGSNVQLFDHDGYPAGEIVTDADGRGSIDLEAGAYTVCLTVLPGQVATRPVVSDDEEPCFDVAVASGRSSWLRFFIVRPQGGNDESLPPSISADGTIVVFASRASNLVAGDTNGSSDIFLHDTTTGATRRISRGLDGESNNASFSPSISADGQLVVFNSFSDNLVEGDTNGTLDAFLYDAASDSIIRINVKDDGSQSIFRVDAPVISADGSKIAYTTSGYDIVADDDGFLADVLVYDVASATTVRVSESTPARRGRATSPALSRDGTRIAYVQAIEDGNRSRKSIIMLYDTRDGSRVQVDPEPGQRYSKNPSISADGTRVAYDSDSPTLVPGETNPYPDVFVYDTTTGTTISASVDSSGNQGDSHASNARMSAEGQQVTFTSESAGLVPDDRNGFSDVFVHDIDSATTTRVSVGNGGVELAEGGRDAAPSADGTRIAFRTSASPVGPTGAPLRQIYLRDTATNVTTLISTVG